MTLTWIFDLSNWVLELSVNYAGEDCMGDTFRGGEIGRFQIGSWITSLKFRREV